MLCMIRRNMGLRSTLVALVLAAILLTPRCTASPFANDGDEWRFAYEPESWDLITIIQRYPLLSLKEPDWEVLSRHEDPFVRTAVSLAIGRKADPNNMRTLTPLLDDQFPLTRKAALWALMQIPSSSMKEPLFSVIGSWENLLAENGPALFVNSSTLVEFFRRISLPTSLLEMPSAARRAWLNSPEASRWMPTFKTPDQHVYRVGAGSKEATISFEESIWSAGDKVRMRLRSVRLPFSNSRRGRISGRGDWFSVDHAGRLASVNEYAQRRSIESSLLEFDAKGFIQADHTLTPGTPLSPGIYLFSYIGDIPGGSIHIARVHRSEAFEKSIANLLQSIRPPKDVDSLKTIELLGRQRVRAAAPGLIELFSENAKRRDSSPNRIIAEALARIGNPQAVSVLIEYPSWRGSDVMGDTFGALRSFGPDAYPHCERHIVAWKETIDRYTASVEHLPRDAESAFQSDQARAVFSLEMALRVLGAEGSEPVDKARLELVSTLACDGRDLMQEEYLPVMVVLRTAIIAVARNHPEHAVEALWAARSRPLVVQEVLSELRRPHTPGAGPVCIGLWKRLQEHPQKYPDIESYLGNKVLPRVAPDFRP